MLTDLVPTGAEQADLFDHRDSDRRAKLMQAMDGLNRRMGKDTVIYAGSGVHREWLATASMKSRSFTTDWRQVIQVIV